MQSTPKAADSSRVIWRKPIRGGSGSIVAVSDTGLVREHNEDSFDASKDGVMIALADGMGGHEGGELASKAAVHAAVHGREVPQNVVPETLIRQSFRDAQRAVRTLQSPNATWTQRPGTTLVVAVVDPRTSTATVGWVGDSRAYLWNGIKLTQVTIDHAAPDHSLTRAIMGGGEEPDIVQVDMRGGAWLLLCTDGLHGFSSNGIIESEMKASSSRGEALSRLLGLAFRRGAKDNVTMMIAST
jgi:serine/threonine protein phosphatase PrpC